MNEEGTLGKTNLPLGDDQDQDKASQSQDSDQEDLMEYEAFLKRKKEEESRDCWGRCMSRLPDMDEVFAYHTQQELNVLDRRLGQFFYIAFVFIFFYIVIYNFGIKKKYQINEQAEGYVYVRGFGEAYSQVNEEYFIWDTSNLLFSSIEDQGIFVPTKFIIERGQEMSVCPNPQLRCLKDSDCTRKQYPDINIKNSQCVAISSSKKVCTMKQWCQPTSTKETHILNNIENFNIIFDSYLYHSDDLIRSQPENGTQIIYPNPKATQYRLIDLLSISGVTSFSKVQDRGGDLIVNMRWDCHDSTDDCDRGIQVTRLDQSGSGYTRVKDNYYVEEGVQKRTRITANGVRIYARAKGSVKKLSVINIVIQISSAIGLLLAAKSLTDFVMLNIFREKNHYRNMKYFHIKTDVVSNQRNQS